MHKRTIIVALGAIVALSPFIGVPYLFLMIALPILGLAIALLAYPFPRPKGEEEEPHDEAAPSV